MSWPDTDYADVATLRPRVAIKAGDTSRDPALQSLLNTAAYLVDFTTRRRRPLNTSGTYQPAFSQSPSETRLFHDPEDGWVAIDDLLTLTALSRGGAALTDAATYQLDPPNTLPRTRLYLATVVTVGYGGQWYGHPIRDTGAQQISVTGTWGYCATANRPPAVAEATLLQAQRLWERIGFSVAQLATAMSNPLRYMDREVTDLLCAAGLTKLAEAGPRIA